jgi:flagellar basal body-associated protein FliL
MSNHVFVSHSHEDSPAADLIVNALEERGVTCWVAPRDVPPGGSYAEAILNAIESATCFVLIYSQHSNVSSHVVREVERALKFGANIVPVRFDDSTPSKSLDYLLATVHWLSVAPDSRDRSVGKAAEQIAACLPEFRSRPRIANPERIPSPRPDTTPAASSSKRFLVWIGAAVALAVAAAAIAFLLSKNSSRPSAQKNEVAATPAVAPSIAATVPPTASLTQASPESTAAAQAISSPNSAHQAVHGIVQDPDGITNVREQPSIRARIIAVVKDGERVEIDQMQGDWVHVILGPNKGGFVHKSRIKIGPEK